MPLFLRNILINFLSRLSDQCYLKAVLLTINIKGARSKRPIPNEILDNQTKGNSYNSVNIHEVLAINHNPNNMFSRRLKALGAV